MVNLLEEYPLDEPTENNVNLLEEYSDDNMPGTPCATVTRVKRRPRRLITLTLMAMR